MKNIKRVLLIIVSCLILCLAISLKADSGWDGDYDYDYGSSDWDFDWGNDYGSSSNNHYHKNTTSSEDVGAALIALGIFIIMGIGITVLLTIPINSMIYNITGVTVHTMVPPVAGLVLIIISMFLTIIAGLIPAKMASKRDPVEALRTE